MSGRGWIALHRKIQDNFLWKEPRVFSKAEAWIDILMEAQHSEEPQEVAFGMTVLRCYYGQSLKAVGTWAERWGWSRSKVHRFFKLLKKWNMIETKSEQITTRLSVCNYGKYDPKRNANETQTKRGRNASETQADTDNNGNNENNEKNGRYSRTSDEFRLSQLLLDLIVKRKPDFKRPNLQSWAVHIDRMIRLDGREPARVEAVIRWCQEDDFWRNNILSTEKLRQQFDQLELKMVRAEQPSKEPKKCFRDCGRTGVDYELDDAGQEYWWCEAHYPFKVPGKGRLAKARQAALQR